MTALADVDRYVAAVRGELADLGPEVVEELTGGLAADLAELAAESDTPLAERVGPPAAYAAELRSAAGLEPTPSRLRRWIMQPARAWSWLHSGPATATASLGRQRSWAQVRDFLADLTPAWWVLRAWVAFVVTDRLFTGEPYGALPARFEGWLVLIALVVLSVQLGREPVRGRWLTRAVLAGNVAAVAALPIAANELIDGVYVDFADYAYAADGIRPGLVIDGVPVSNIYAYDAEGEPIYGVQLFSQDGTPLEISEGDRGTSVRNGMRALLPAIDDDGDRLWNVFPLGIEGRGPGSDTRQRAPHIPDWAGPVDWFAQVEPETVVTTPPPTTPPPPTSPPTAPAIQTTTPPAEPGW